MGGGGLSPAVHNCGGRCACMSVLLQRPVAKLRPCRPPFPGFGLPVPASGENGAAFVLPLFQAIDFIALWVKNVLLFLLHAPYAASVKRAHGHHDMDVELPPPMYFCWRAPLLQIKFLSSGEKNNFFPFLCINSFHKEIMRLVPKKKEILILPFLSGPLAFAQAGRIFYLQ